MAPHLRAKQKQGSIGRLLFTLLMIVVGVVFCSTSLFLAGDYYCSRDINHWMPVYPDAEVAQVVRTGFIRPRASGITEMVYFTEDDVIDVRTWYREYRRDITRNTVNSSNPNAAARGIATTNNSIFASRDENGEDNGTFIRQTSECAYS